MSHHTRCFIHKLALSYFRNHTEFSVDISEPSIVLWGKNGAGKTNILEAISLFSPGKGLRGAPATEFFQLSKHQGTHISPEPWAAATLIDGTRGITERLGTGAKERKHGGGYAANRAVSINGKNSTQSELSDVLSVLWTAPSLQHKLTESATERRRWLDRLTYTLFPKHERTLRAYEHYVKERMRLLTCPTGYDSAWCDALEEHIAQRGTLICHHRIETITLINQAIYATRTPFPSACITINGAAEPPSSSLSDEDTKEQWKRRFRENRKNDALTGRTAYGAHRDNVSLIYVERDMDYRMCSSGQQKALLLSIFLAHGKLTKDISGYAPIMLVDEAFSQLDEEKRIYFFDVLSATAGQSWITGTDEEDFKIACRDATLLHISP